METLVAVQRQRLGYNTKGAMGESEDWWDLVFDSDELRFFVEHSWDRVQLSKLEQPSNVGTVEIDVNTFLREGPEKPRLALARRLGKLFNND
ncbi:hypothetical protein [Hyphomicrobium sp. NDB2Meth4]|uniref:hypothetical protein n=1 Tax=Hyphomicrobium sp. NDB2Meth4 TaxID=1892846 RepID=UPI0009304A29|nr:hypothetical protein [Hyphomicrobium sp. NDB2Meth4]